eukprot:1279458-Prymnesium_polylepis.1
MPPAAPPAATRTAPKPCVQVRGLPAGLSSDELAAAFAHCGAVERARFVGGGGGGVSGGSGMDVGGPGVGGGGSLGVVLFRSEDAVGTALRLDGAPLLLPDRCGGAAIVCVARGPERAKDVKRRDGAAVMPRTTASGSRAGLPRSSQASAQPLLVDLQPRGPASVAVVIRRVGTGSNS